MSVTAMALIAAAVIGLPVVLMFAFNGTNQADSRGRRISRKWKSSRRGRALETGRGPTAS